MSITRLASCAHADASTVDSESAVEFATGSSPATAINVDGSDEEFTVDLDKILDVNSTICIEKEIACDTIGSVCSYTRNHFLPYIEECTMELIAQLPHYYDGIRKSATDSLLEIVRSFYDLSGGGEWTAGVANVDYVDPRVKELIHHILPPLIEM